MTGGKIHKDYAWLENPLIHQDTLSLLMFLCLIKYLEYLPSITRIPQRISLKIHPQKLQANFMRQKIGDNKTSGAIFPTRPIGKQQRNKCYISPSTLQLTLVGLEFSSCSSEVVKTCSICNIISHQHDQQPGLKLSLKQETWCFKNILLYLFQTTNKQFNHLKKTKLLCKLIIFLKHPVLPCTRHAAKSSSS